MTKSPTAMVRTSGPTSSTTPTNSWPMRRGFLVGVMPRYGHRSEPQTHAATTRTMASPPVERTGSGTSSRRTSRSPWITVASMAPSLRARWSSGQRGAMRRPQRRAVELRAARSDAATPARGEPATEDRGLSECTNLAQTNETKGFAEGDHVHCQIPLRIASHFDANSLISSGDAPFGVIQPPDTAATVGSAR